MDFVSGKWQAEIDVRDFIQKNYTPYTGDETFLAGPTDSTKKLWDEVTTENVKELADIDGYWSDFFALFGFGADGINYDADTDPVYDIASLK